MRVATTSTGPCSPALGIEGHDTGVAPSQADLVKRATEFRSVPSTADIALVVASELFP